ncbi:MAG: TonB-dependent receptor domain-containing protein, partial [Novosphingobium sp.]
EFVNAFEIGSKNTFANGKVTLNLTGFYYDYKGLQLSRIVNRTSQNANVDAKIYGLEAEAILRPTQELTLNLNASYLHTEVTNTPVPIADTRDPGGGRADAVIIKDMTNAANCAIGSNAGNAAAVNGFVNAVNAALGLGPTQSFGAGSGIASRGAYSICAQLAGVIANPTGALGTAINAAGNFGVVGGTLPFTYYANGVPKSIVGNKLPGAPDYKFSAGVQYAIPVGDMTITPRVDFIYTGKSYGNVFNGLVNEVPSFTQLNAQLQIDGADKKWFARAWVQNLSNNSAITGLYVTDQSSGLYTNIFTLEPRRYGLTAGIKF